MNGYRKANDMSLASSENIGLHLLCRVAGVIAVSTNLAYKLGANFTETYVTSIFKEKSLKLNQICFHAPTSS
jgi:hypothetical protein